MSLAASALPCGPSKASTVAITVFVLLVTAVALSEHNVALAIYAVSFWHYPLYWLGYRHGAMPLAAFKRDAMLTKSVSLVASGVAYFSAPLDAVSLAVVAAGFALNAMAARALGSDRTYYGHEVAGLPRLEASRFPYNLTAHPMLLGNMAAYAGMLINPAFRAHWWPLAAAHVALNLGLLVMETAVAPRRPPVRREPVFIALATAVAAFAGGAAGWMAGALRAGDGSLTGTLTGALAGMHLAVMYFCYTWSAWPPLAGRPQQRKDTA